MVSISVEGVLGLSDIKSPGGKALVSSLILRGSTVSLNLNASNGSIMRLWVVGRHVIGHGIRIGVRHGEGHGQTGQSNSDKCLERFVN